MNSVFGIYSNTQLAEAAVDILVSAGIPSSAISVLYPDNESSRTFAERKFTRPPAGTASGETSQLPLAGLQGFSDPAAGPQAGALSAALAQMGVPAEWCAGRVLEGKILLSAETKNADQQACADGILRYSRAEDVATVTEPDNLVAKPSQEGPDIGTRNVAPIHGR